MSEFGARATMRQLRDRAERYAPSGASVATLTRPANNTADVRYTDGTRKVILHQTDILTVAPDGTLTINTGGYNTTTTRDRLKSLLPNGWQVHTRKGDIYLSRYEGSGVHSPATPFHKVCTIAPDGAVSPDVSPRDLLDKAAQINRFMEHVKRTGLPAVEMSGGDPWVFVPSQVDVDTMQDWLDTLYWTRRLFVLSLEHVNMQPAGIAWTLYRIDHDGGKLDKMEIGRVRRYIRGIMGREH